MASNPFQQLNVYTNISCKNKKVKDCYRLLYHKELWIKAYTNLFPNANIDEKTIDVIIESLRHRTYRFSPIRQNAISSQLNVSDRIVLEVLSMILNTIYEPVFSKHSHCCIKNRSYQTALLDIKNSWHGVTWCIQGVIERNWSRNQYHFLLKLLGRKIDDRRFLLLIHNALNSGVMNHFQFRNTFNYIARTSNFSLLLLNIYLHEFDSFIENHLKRIHSNSPIKYVRFANHFVIGIASSKEMSRKTHVLIQDFLNGKLQFRLREDQTTLFHIEKDIPFLGYQFTLNKKKNNSIQLKIPTRSLQMFAANHGYGNLQCLTVNSRRKLINLTEIEILLLYNKELENFAKFYKLADNIHQLNKLFYIAERSFLKTVATKKKSTSKRIAVRMSQYQQGRLCYVQQTKHGEQLVHTFLKLTDLKEQW